MNRSQVYALLVIVLLVVSAGMAWNFLVTPEQRPIGERVGNAAEALPNLTEAGRALENRTPGEKIGDGVRDLGKDIKDATDNDSSTTSDSSFLTKPESRIE